MRRLRTTAAGAAASTGFGVAAGLLANIFTDGWSWAVGAGLVVLTVVWIAFEAWRASMPGEATDDPVPVAPTRVPGGLPRIWNIEARNPHFTDRDETLVALRTKLGSDDRQGRPQRVQVLRGIGGVGKTQLAAEYAYRFADAYDIGWWITAEDPALIGEQLASLGVQLGIVNQATETATAAATVKTWLRQTNRWLVIMDNAEDPTHVRPWLPGGQGHVIITTRGGSWEHVGVGVNVEPMARADSVALLRAHDGRLSHLDAGHLAEALGDLPLALVQASGYLTDTAISVEGYLNLLDTRADTLLHEGDSGNYPSLAAAIAVTTDRLGHSDSAGLAVVRLGAFLAPETIPVAWLSGVQTLTATTVGSVLPLVTMAQDRVAAGRAVRSAGKLGLVTTTDNGFRLHRLVQAVIRDQVPTFSDRSAFLAYARAVLVSHRPGDPEDPAEWPKWARAIPHVLALDPSTGTEEMWCELVCDTSWLMLERGEADAAARLAGDLRKGWKVSLGPNSYYTLWATRCLGRALREMGQYENAKTVYADALARYQDTFGEENLHTLKLAHGSAINLHLLGEYADALELQHKTWEKYRHVQGDDHRHTLHSANHLANDLRALGRLDEAREWHERTLTRYKRVAGLDNPDTLRCASNLALDLCALKRYDEARVILEDTLARRRRVLGDNNRYTLQSARTLAETLLLLRQFVQARILLEETLANCQRALGPDHPETLSSATDLAETLHLTHEDAKALPQASDTFERYLRTLGPAHPHTMHAADILVAILTTVGHENEALTVRQRTARRDSTNRSQEGAGAA